MFQKSTAPLFLTALAVLGLLSPRIWSDIQRVRFDASMDTFLAADQRAQESLEKFGEVLQESHTVMVVVTVDDLFSDQGAKLIHEIGRSLETIDGVPRVIDLVRGERPVRRDGFVIDPRRFVDWQPFLPQDPMTDEEWAEQRELVTGFPWSRDLLVSRDGEHAMLIAEVGRPMNTQERRLALRAEIEEVLEPFEERVGGIHIGAFPFIEAEVQAGLESDLSRFLNVLPILLVVILLVAFRSIWVLLSVLTFEAIGVGLLPTLFVLRDSPINLYTAILFPLVAGLQLTFLTHLFSALQRRLGEGHPFPEALRGALLHVGWPSAVALLTTVIGLLALNFCEVAAVRQVGELGWQAVVVAFVVTFVPAWALSLLWRPKLSEASVLPHHEPNAWTAGIERACRFVIGRPRAVIVFWSVFVLAAIPAAWSVRTDLRAIEFLSPESVSRQGLEFVDDHVGGMNVFELQLDSGEPGGLDTYEALVFLEKLREHAEAIDEITNIYTYAQVFTLMNQLWQNDPEAGVPESSLLRGAFSWAIRNQDFSFDDALYDDAIQVTNVFVRTQDMPAKAYLATLEDLLGRAQPEVPEGMTLDLKFGLHSVLESDRKIVDSQLESLGLAIGAVFVVLALLWTSFRLSTVALLANIPALAGILALLGYGGVPLNSVTVMVAAVVLGIAVDDSIHLLSYWREQRDRHESRAVAVAHVLGRKLRAMACTTAVLIAGMAVFLGAGFPPVADFGLASIVALAVALASILTLVPVLLLAIDREPEVVEDQLPGEPPLVSSASSD